MLHEVGRFILEEAVGEALGGLVRRARSREAHRLKSAAWLCLIASVVSFAVAARWPDAAHSGAVIIAGLIAAVATLGFGFWASLVNTWSGQAGA